MIFLSYKSVPLYSCNEASYADHRSEETMFDIVEMS